MSIDVSEMSVDHGNETSNPAWELSHQEKSVTPVRRRRSRIASKNLSHSFSLYAGDNDLMDEHEEETILSEVVEMKSNGTSFYRTDSGFTEASNFTTNGDDSLRNFEVKGAHLAFRYNDENSMDISMRSDLQF